MAPGDLAMRHDVELLADAGILHAPVMTWPMSWPDVARDVLAEGVAAADGQSHVQDALLRVQIAARAAQHSGAGSLQWRVAGGTDAEDLRGFAADPREQGEAGVSASWLTERFAVRMQATVVANAEDAQTLRLDGSYVGVNLGNFMISAGAMERWWGPGWDGSLILGTNARPIPSLTIERNLSTPFRSRWLHWIGPWRASFSVGQAEGATSARDHDLAVLPDVKFLAARVNFKPRPWLEIALSRTAQFCGRGRDCSLSTLKNVLIGNDNSGDSLARNREPGNQLAGYDFRMSSPWHALPLAVYGQFIGEDEANGLPSKFLGLFGAETWGGTRWGSVRVRAEYADTSCEFTRADPQYDCAYRNTLFSQGYTFRGRVIGDAMDGDGRRYTASAMLVRPSGESLSLSLSKIDLNRGGTVPDLDHALSLQPAEVKLAQLRYRRAIGAGRLAVGLNYDRRSAASRSSSDSQAFVEWHQRY